MKTGAKALSEAGEIQHQFLEDQNAIAVLRGRSVLVDETVLTAWREFLAPVFPTGMALVPVGGYGRRELFPCSDVDLLLLVERDIHGDAQRAALSGFLRALWDAGLRLSHSVRTAGECCSLQQHNIELSISLLDQRFLTGDEKLHEMLAGRLPKFFQSNRQALLRHLTVLAEMRHEKFQRTIYHLEPNIKETPGGLRDLHLIEWLRRLRGAEPGEDLGEAAEFLARLRCHLHFRAGRDQNVLNFEAQEEMSEDPSAWMRQYYRHARAIHRAGLRQMELSEALLETSLLRGFRDWRSRLSNAEFTVSRDRVYLRSPLQLAADPELALRLFLFTARHGIRPSLDAERRIREHLPGLKRHFAQPGSIWPLLREMLSQARAAVALRSMYESGLLEALFPEFERIESLVVRDFYHRYTVDEHTLIGIESLERLRDQHERPLRNFSELLAETEEVPLLLLALLLHDIGKGEGQGRHAAASVRYAAVALDRIGVPEQAKATVLFLIEHHLDLSLAMTSRDLSDPATAYDLAHRVGTLENLKYLTLVTYGDISAVHPAAMTPWRAEQLWRLHVVTHNELTRELDSERIHRGPDEEPELAAFLEGFPVRYLRTHPPSEIFEHMALARQSRQGGVALDLRRQQGMYRLTVITGDHPNLFSSLVGTLSSFGMDIVKAEAFANRGGTILDTFVFSDPMRTLELNPMEIERLKLTLQRAARGREDVARLLKGRAKSWASRLPGRIEPRVSFDSKASQSATLIEVITEDRPGLLYHLASTISGAGCSIEVVLIDTEAHKAIDVFYVTSAGRKLTPDLEAELRRALLAVCGPSAEGTVSA